jgi:hypothetical protein
MAIRNPRWLAKCLRQNAVDCEKATSDDLRSEHRALLLRTAEHYRMHADKTDDEMDPIDALLLGEVLEAWIVLERARDLLDPRLK